MSTIAESAFTLLAFWLGLQGPVWLYNWFKGLVRPGAQFLD